MIRSRTVLSVVSGGALAAQWAPAAAPFVSRAARGLGIPTRLPSGCGVLLSFDDGPHPYGTPAVLAELERRRLQAVFFVSGEQAARHGALVCEIAAAGHEVALHGYRHQTRRQWSRRLLADDTRRAVDVLWRGAGALPRLYRPPHGVFSLTGLSLIRSLGLAPLLWSKWGRDWEPRASVSAIVRRATAGIRAGDVVLLHDADHYGAAGSWRRTVAALPEIADRIEAAGLRTASVRSSPASARLALTL
jgi:peptidoglycan/xylan/chitin deacetylase (PgdA/CDA1 family)